MVKGHNLRVAIRLDYHDFVPPGGETAAKKVKDTIREERGEVQIVHLSIQVQVLQYFSILFCLTRSYGRAMSSMLSVSVKREGTR